MFDLRTIASINEAEAALDEVTRHRIDLIRNPPKRMPVRADRVRDPKVFIVWVLRAYMRRMRQREARKTGVTLAHDGRLVGHRV